MKRVFCSAFLLVLLALGLSGCGGSDGPVMVDPPAGTGFRVGLRASSETVTNGGTIQLTAWVYGPDGNLVMTDDAGVSFVADLKGTFGGGGTTKITGGTALTTFTWEDSSASDNPDPSRVLRITATYRGAATSVDLIASANTF